MVLVEFLNTPRENLTLLASAPLRISTVILVRLMQPNTYKTLRCTSRISQVLPWETPTLLQSLNTIQLVVLPIRGLCQSNTAALLVPQSPVNTTKQDVRLTKNRGPVTSQRSPQISPTHPPMPYPPIAQIQQLHSPTTSSCPSILVFVSHSDTLHHP